MIPTFAAIVVLATAAGASAASSHQLGYSPEITRIIKAANADGIDLVTLPFASAAFSSITAISSPVNSTVPSPSNATRIDVHVHAVPDFYLALVPVTGGSPTPQWDVQTHMSFMANNSIGHSILSISTPGADVVLGDEPGTVGMARLLNEWLAALCRTYPTKFSFYATMPLPYTQAAIREAAYALDHLHAAGLGVMSNHAGKYLGNPSFTPFFAALDARNSTREILFVHPANPVQNVNGTWISADPTVYPPGIVEFFFETARTVMDLTLTQTLQNFSGVHYVIPHVGGAFPAIEDRVLKSAGFQALEASSKAIYNSRFWWDSAGPTYFDQAKGLLGYGEPAGQLLFGSDYPYAHAGYEDAIGAIVDADFVTAREKEGIFAGNARKLFGGRAAGI